MNKGLEGITVAETVLSHIDGDHGRLILRGLSIEDIAGSRTFEEAVYFLWNGQFPESAALKDFQKELKQAMFISEDEKKMLQQLPANLDTMSYLMAAFSGLERSSFQWPLTKKQAVRLLARMPVIIGCKHAMDTGQDVPEPLEKAGFSEQLLYMIHGRRPSEAQIRALDIYLILTMEHGMNASTFTARVITSTQSDMVSAVVGAMGAMKGPLHGGAPSGVLDMLTAIQTEERAYAWIEEHLLKGEKLMGFGHRVYRTDDPRAKVLREVVYKMAGDDPWFSLAAHVEQTALSALEKRKPGRKLYTNVEFYAAAVFKALEIPKELDTAIFTSSRMAGWTAHILEQSNDNRIIRPSSRYVGV
jgi:citrate synthase